MTANRILGVAFLVLALALATQLGGRAAAQDNADGNAELWEQFRMEPAWAPESDRPESHDAGWLERHGAEIGLGSLGDDLAATDCASCHTEDSCASCHASSGMRTGVHPPGYVVLHSGDALAGQDSCSSCHSPTRFCTGCHSQMELAGTNSSRPPAGVRVHDEDWLTPTALVNHASEARADILSCAGCHDANTCVSCHIDVNPHGDEFLDRCAMMLESAEQTCAACHTRSSGTPIEVIREVPGCRR